MSHGKKKEEKAEFRARQNLSRGRRLKLFLSWAME